MPESFGKGPTQKQEKDPTPRIEESANYYERLGLKRGDPQFEAKLREAFRRLSALYHPSAQGGGNEAKMKLISEAQATLKYPEKRAAYDAVTFTPKRPEPRPQNESRRSRFSFEDLFGEGMSRGGTAPRTENPEAILDEAVRKAGMGTFFFKSFVQDAQAKGVPRAENLIQNAKVIQVILDEAISKAKMGPYFYGLYIKGWVRDAGFDRRVTDLNTTLLSIIRAESLSKAKTGAHFFSTYLKDWQGHNPSLNTQELTNNPELLKFLKQEGEVKKKVGGYFYKSFLTDWQKAGIDIEKIK